MYKYDKEKLREAMEKYLGNEWWKEVYEKAPSDECKSFLKMTFYRSSCGEPVGEEYKELRESVRGSLGLEDWKYLYKVMPGPFRKICKEKIKELEG